MQWMSFYDVTYPGIKDIHVAVGRGLLRQSQRLKRVSCRWCMRKETSRNEVVPQVLCHRGPLTLVKLKGGPESVLAGI